MDDDSIQWVIDALNNPSVAKGYRENHKYDEIRADRNISWCPECKQKWEIYEGKLWASLDRQLWKEKVCPECCVE